MPLNPLEIQKNRQHSHLPPAAKRQRPCNQGVTPPVGTTSSGLGCGKWDKTLIARSYRKPRWLCQSRTCACARRCAAAATTGAPKSATGIGSACSCCHGKRHLAQMGPWKVDAFLSVSPPRPTWPRDAERGARRGSVSFSTSMPGQNLPWFAILVHAKGSVHHPVGPTAPKSGDVSCNFRVPCG